MAQRRGDAGGAGTAGRSPHATNGSLPDEVSARTPRLNYIANLVGHPGLAIPCGFDEDGLPLSLQIVGSPMDDQSVLDLGMAYQRETDWHLRRPPYPWRE